MEATEEMKEQAREFLRRRLDSEQSYSANLLKYLDAAVDSICAIIIRYGITAEQLMSNRIPEKARREIDEIIAELAAEIAEAVLLLAKDENDDLDWFIAFLKREFEDGWTFDERLKMYTDNFGKQVLMAIAALALLEVSTNLWAREIQKNIRDLYGSSFVKAAASQRLSFFSPVGYGRGIPHNMAVALDTLGRQEIANAWMEYEYEQEKKDGALGFFVFRGSSYECPLCDSYVGWHDINDVGGRPTYHPHCYCYVVYVKL